jgi:hypothetical protein
MPAIRDKLPPFRKELAELTGRIKEYTASARAGNGGTRGNPEMGKALARLLEALETRDIDAIDAALALLQDLPLTGTTRAVVSGMADSILMMDFQKAENAAATLLRQGD